MLSVGRNWFGQLAGALGRGGAVSGVGRRAQRRRGPEPVDTAMLLAIAAIILLGTVMVYSASIAVSDAKPALAPTHFLIRHLIALVVGLGLAAAAFSTPIAVWQRCAPWLFVGVLVLLVVVLIPGIGLKINGAYRWIPLGPFTLQPSELLKLAAVIYAADFTVRKQDYMHSFRKGFLPMATVMAVVGSLLQLQPDLGGFGVVVAISMGILFLGGLNGRLFVGICIALTGAFAAIIWMFPWRRERIFAYLNVFDPEYTSGKGYQLAHSLIAFGRGEWFGKGLGRSVEKLNHLPQAHTDFIAAVIGEELGLIGLLVVVGLFYWLVKRAFEIGRQAVALERSFAGLVAQGIGIWIGIQVFINVGVATGLLPTKGLTLPLVSYGGSSLIATLIGLGLLARVDYENRVLMRGGRL